MADVSVRKLVKKFGLMEVVHGIDFDVADREFVVLVGPSGCGKSTTLRMIAGLETVSDGEIHINGEPVNDVPPRDRDIAMVFQDYALYPHMSVRQNLAFGLKMRNMPRAKIEDAVQRTADILQIRELLDRKPKQLSGGQRQRVAIGRAIAREPALFLFDEPLSNLDAKLRVEMRTQIKRLHIAFNATSIYVTHDQTEAMTLADRIIVLRSGFIEQVGTPNELYSQPANSFVAGFIGSPTMNFVDATLAQQGDTVWVVFDGGTRLPLPDAIRSQLQSHIDRKVLFGVRPEHLTNVFTAEKRDGAGLVPLDIPVEIVEPLGADTLVFSRLGKTEIVSRVATTADLRPGEQIRVHVDTDSVHLFDPETGNRLATSPRRLNAP